MILCGLEANTTSFSKHAEPFDSVVLRFVRRMNLSFPNVLPRMISFLHSR